MKIRAHRVALRHLNQGHVLVIASAQSRLSYDDYSKFMVIRHTTNELYERRKRLAEAGTGGVEP